MASNDIDALVNELIAAHFPPAVHANMTLQQKECLQTCIQHALVEGGIQVMAGKNGGEFNTVTLEINKDAKEFEKTLDHLANTQRVASSAYPWGWHYQDDDVQKKFREFCKRST